MHFTTKYDVLVVGGGASGLMAAGNAASNGAKTLVLEKMSRCGRKLRITGKGRCNLTNIAPIEDFLEHIEPDKKFLYQVFSQFFSEELISFFSSVGIKTVVERGGRVFPFENRAQDVVDAMVTWIEKKGVEQSCNFRVETLLVQNGITKGVVSDGREIFSETVILSTGGSSYPLTGSDGSSFSMIKNLGHTIVPLRPALVPLRTVKEINRPLAGLDLKNISLKLFIDKKLIHQYFGEISFIEGAVSGPLILTVSRQAVDAINAGHAVSLSIDLKPALDNDKLDKRILRELCIAGKKPFSEVLKTLLPSKLIPVLLQQCNIDQGKISNIITSSERKKLLHWLKNFEIPVTGYCGFDEAIISAGGISLKEINPRTMESKIVKNLYFSGELIDINADTGGYNLQVAFSTGWVAGKNAAERASIDQKN